MVSYMAIPQFKITLGSTVYENSQGISAEIVRLENGFDTATIVMNDFQSLLYPNIVTAGTAFQIDIKDYSDVLYTTISKGVVRFPILPFGENETVRLKCDGAGYGFGDTVCAEEYGSQSKNPTLDTLKKIITGDDGVNPITTGLVPNWVNKVLRSDTNSGFNYDTSNVDTITGTIPYLYFPYKPNNKVLDDICDLVTAINAGSAGPHWIVEIDDKLRVKLINSSQTGWTKYYGDDEANATLEQEVDFTRFQFEKMGPEANFIIYYGILRKPGNERWTEQGETFWSGTDAVISDASDVKVVGDYSILVNGSYVAGGEYAWTPVAKNAGWDFTKIGSMQNPPLIALYIQEYDPNLIAFDYLHLRLQTTDTRYFSVDLHPKIVTSNKWVHFSYPIGPYYQSNLKDEDLFTWTETGSPAPSWSSINAICFYFRAPLGAYNNFYVDDLHFEANMCRIARQRYPSEGGTLGTTSNPLKIKVINDNLGKDDTLKETDDSGTLARLAYAELLRLQKNSLVGQLTVPMIKDVLPGQWFHIRAKKTASGSFNINTDMRATKVIHTISTDGFFTTLELTDDLTNSHARSAYESINKVWSSLRPEFQDRQATTIKAGQIDIRIPRFEKDYPS